MKKKIIIFLISQILLADCILAQELVQKQKQKLFVAGIMFGSTNGVTLRRKLDNKNIVEMKLGSHTDQTEMDFNYIKNHKIKENLIMDSGWMFELGSGCMVRTGGFTRERRLTKYENGIPEYEVIPVEKTGEIHFSALFGLLHRYREFDFFIEILPSLKVAPGISFEFNSVAGLHHYF